MGIDERLVQKLSLSLAALIVFAAGWLTPVAAQEAALRIAMSGSFAPFSTIDHEGRLVGFDVDIARALARRMERKAVLVQVDWNGIQASLQSGKVDLICGSMAITQARLEQMGFSLPYYVSGAQLFGREDSPPARLGVTESSTYARFISEHPEMFRHASVTAYGSEAEILTALRADKVDGFVSDRIVGSYYLSQKGAPSAVPLGTLLYVESCGIAARRDDVELVRQVNSALLEVIQSGEYEAIYRKWVGHSPELELLFQQWGVFAEELPTDHPRAGPRTADPDPNSGILGLLFQGAALTIQLSLLTGTISLVTGLALGLASVSQSRTVRGLASLYVALVRGTPLLVQLFLSYFVLATALNRWLGYEAMGAFASALLALVVNATAYNGETLRGGILGVEQGQWDAALSLGMTRARVLTRIVLPQAFRSCLPSLGNNLVVLVKDTSLVGAITLIELTYTARNLVFQTGQAFLPFMIAAGFYLVIISALSLLVRWGERRLLTP